MGQPDENEIQALVSGANGYQKLKILKILLVLSYITIVYLQEWLRDLDSTQFDKEGLTQLKEADEIKERLKTVLEQLQGDAPMNPPQARG